MTRLLTSIKSTADLVAAGLLDETQEQDIRPVVNKYAVAITPTMASLIDTTDPNDPIAKQFVPQTKELHRLPQERDDAIGDTLKSPVKGIVHRYPDRALLKLVSVCPIYCRFCFRREMVGPKQDGVLSQYEFSDALYYLKRHPEIWEVIITGGDPLILSPRRIKDVTSALNAIEHVKVTRWHTRVPVVMPEHMTDALIAALAATKKSVYVSVHANHARELTPEARSVCKRLTKAGIGLISQTVLLKGINDNVETLCDLMRAFVETGIKPYYLHHPDLAPGTSHFRVPIKKGQALMRELRQHLSGLAQPTYVLDIPGANGKVPVQEGYVEERSNGQYHLVDPKGAHHIYEDEHLPDENFP